MGDNSRSTKPLNSSDEGWIEALKGPADRVMATLGLPPGNAGVLAAYEGLLTDLVVDQADAADVAALAAAGVRLHATDTRIAAPEAAARFAQWLMRLP